MEEEKPYKNMMEKWEIHMEWSEKYDGMWSYEDKACNASDHECWELCL